MRNILTVIHTEHEYDQALRQLASLMDAQPRTAEEKHLEVLAILVSDYERRHHPIPPPDPIDYLVHMMEAQGLTEMDLEVVIGNRGCVQAVLSRSRPLSLRMIRGLHNTFGLSPAALIQKYPARRDNGLVHSHN